MSHVQVPRHHPQQGDQAVLPPVHDVSQLLLGSNHQNRISGEIVERNLLCQSCILPSFIFIYRPSLERERKLIRKLYLTRRSCISVSDYELYLNHMHHIATIIFIFYFVNVHYNTQTWSDLFQILDLF